MLTDHVHAAATHQSINCWTALHGGNFTPCYSLGRFQHFKMCDNLVWQDLMKLSVTVMSLRTGHAHVSDRITRGRNAIFGHVARLSDNIPAHQAMLCQVELSVGRPPDPSWKRQPGRPRTKWTDQLCRVNNNVPIATLWRQAIGRGHSRATLRSEPILNAEVVLICHFITNL